MIFIRKCWLFLLALMTILVDWTEFHLKKILFQKKSGCRLFGNCTFVQLLAWKNILLRCFCVSGVQQPVCAVLNRCLSWEMSAWGLHLHSFLAWRWNLQEKAGTSRWEGRSLGVWVVTKATIQFISRIKTNNSYYWYKYVWMAVCHSTECMKLKIYNYVPWFKKDEIIYNQT